MINRTVPGSDESAGGADDSDYANSAGVGGPSEFQLGNDGRVVVVIVPEM